MIKPLQATIEGYGGRAVSVFAALDDDSGILVVSAIADASARREGCFVIAANARADRDALFSHERLADGIGAYYAIKTRAASDGQTTCLRFGQRANGADPASAIELDGVNVQGPMYRISPDVSNAQIATLALCLHANQADMVTETIEMADVFSRLLKGCSYTI